MGSKNRILFLLAVLVGVAAIAGIYYIYNKESSSVIILNHEPAVGQQADQPLPASSNVDVTADSILREVNAEASINAEVEGDATLLKSDNQAVGDFGQSINDTGL